MTMDELFEFFGGANAFSGKLGLHQYTVDRWKKYGIPQKYWEQIANETNLTVQDIFYISHSVVKKDAK